MSCIGIQFSLSGEAFDVGREVRCTTASAKDVGEFATSDIDGVVAIDRAQSAAAINTFIFFVLNAGEVEGYVSILVGHVTAVEEVVDLHFSA